MTIKEAREDLKRVFTRYINSPSFQSDCETILKDIERLEDLEKLEKENEILKNQILSLELDTCIPELKKQNDKLKQDLDKLKKLEKLFINNTNIGFYKSGDDTYYVLQIPDKTFIHISKEAYDLLKEVFGYE